MTMNRGTMRTIRRSTEDLMDRLDYTAGAVRILLFLYFPSLATALGANAGSLWCAGIGLLIGIGIAAVLSSFLTAGVKIVKHLLVTQDELLRTLKPESEEFLDPTADERLGEQRDRLPFDPETEDDPESWTAEDFEAGEPETADLEDGEYE